MKKFLSFPLLLLIVFSFCCACSCSKDDNLIVYRNYYDQDVTTFNYMITNEYQDIIHIANFVDGLVENDKYGNIVPSIANSWEDEIVDGKQIWTFYLKDNVYWSDYNGDKYALVTAHDFVTSLKYSLNYNSKSNNYNLAGSLLENGLNYYHATLINNFDYAEVTSTIERLRSEDNVSELSYYENIKNIFDSCLASGQCIDDFSIVGIKALDDFTLQFTLTKPIPYFLSALTYYSFLPANDRFIEEIGFNNFGTSEKTLLYNGAYLLDTYSHNSRIEYIKNHNYWDKDNVFIDKLVFTKSIAFHSAGYTRIAYESGNIDEFVVNSLDEKGWNKYVLGSDATGDENNPKGNNTYVSNKVNNFTTYYLIFNQNRTHYNYSILTKEENLLANKALQNVSFRRALTHLLNRSYYFNNDLNLMISSIVPEGFINLDDKDYYEYFVEEYSMKNGISYEEASLKFSLDPLYEYDLGQYYLNIALEELNLNENSLPIKIEYTYYYDENYINYDKSRIDKWNRALNGCNNTDPCTYDKVMIVYNDAVNSINDFNIAFMNKEYNATIIGLYPDYNDPTTYLSSFSSYGELNSYINNNNTTKIDSYLDSINNHYDNLVERYKLCAQLEYYLIFEQSLVIPLALKYSNKQIVVSNLVPFERMTASYGLSPFKYKYRKKRTKDYTQEEIATLKQKYIEGKSSS